MAFIKSEFTIPSVVGDCDLRGSRWLPKNGEVRAVLQIIHGMLEHIGRYDAFADFFTSRGFAVYGVSHLGHGLSVNEKYPRGYFGEHNGNGVVFRDDAHQLSDVIRQEQPGKPLFIIGYSMGSFVARQYIASYGGDIQGAIICATSGPNPLMPAALVFSGVLSGFKSKEQGDLMNKLAFGNYNARTEGKTPFDWISAHEEHVADFMSDPLTDFVFSNQGFHDLVTMNNTVCKKETISAAPIDLPLFFISGEEDPLGDYGKGVRKTVMDFLETGHRNVHMKLYPGRRHEIHKEPGCEDVLQDILSFCEAQ